MPLRMCCICRESKEKSQLIRVACPKDGEPQLDMDNKIMGRGAYFCDIECLRLAQKRDALSRAFRKKVTLDAYNRILAGVADGE